MAHGETGGTEIIDVKTLSKGEDYTEIVNGKIGLSGSTSLDAKMVSKVEDYVNIVNSETITPATTTHDAKCTVLQNESNQVSEIRKPSVVENLNSQSITEDLETASIDVNDEASRKRKRQLARDKKAAIVILNPHDNIGDTEIANSGSGHLPSLEGLAAQSHIDGGKQIDKNMVRSLYAKMTIEDVEIPKDQNLGDSSLKDFVMRNHVAMSRKKLLVLDVNGLLADIIFPPPKDCKSDKNILRRAIFKRPFLDGFLGFCFENFEVAIWSSRTRKILDPVVDYLLGDLKKQLLFLWDLSYCTNSSARSLENKHKFIVFKELRKIWEQNGHNLASENGYYDESNTLLLDDSPYKALLNPKHTGIFPLSYSYMDINDNSLGPDGDLRGYLEGVAATEDVKMYLQQHPFGQPAIDETSSHWAFYSGVLERDP
ncbi:probable C-terminal domain small phosphatase [Cynara cardunculus var. scolymus]|uniref:Mitochondrial import inner membrane translocase subunit TIM50 n=1 Tax=Cynara cardunculus var. scolymus TaxID=59895 RepID=A0A103Y4Y4_CYNCS|nr:probable C-terminal domain small phosphatase [Cynara cardunculus var. scolymus]XP_024975034.1 probable C-terminal domain small phosphatase [Cynara cardunculus var. scolymus]XP_024975035.1 probable C-terminal domain small phosphatase [Cynara cardunculus var. scolymus]KVI02590.1 HAD-like domain-containing protein [Cynara cardunculus var. scolymus]